MVEREQSNEDATRGRKHLVLPSKVTWVKFTSLSELQRGLGGGLNKIMFVKYLALHILASFHFFWKGGEKEGGSEDRKW